MAVLEIRPPSRDFTGRDAEIRTLIQRLQPGTSAAVTAVRGVGGIGKTELAVRVAHLIRPMWPDGGLKIELFGTGEPASPRRVMEDVVLHYHPQSKLPDDDAAVLEIYRTVLRERQILLLLDNAADAAQVLDLLPPPPSVAIVTSRAAIHLGGLAPLRLGDLPPPEAQALIAKIVGDARTMTQAERAAVAEACCGHPLALEVAAIHLRDHPATRVETYVARITERRDKLKLDGNPDSDVVAVLGLSVESLEKADPDLARRWRDLAVFPADFGFEAAAMFWGDADADAALERLERLETLGLVEPAGDGRHRLHDLLRDVALLRRAEPEIATARLRHAFVYCVMLGVANELYLTGGIVRIGEALALFDRERANIFAGRAAAVSRAAVDDKAVALVADYANAGVYVTNLRLHPREWIGWWQDALGGSRKIGDRGGESNALGNLGLAYADLGETTKAIEHHEKQLAIAREIGDRRGEGAALGNLGNAYADLGEATKAIEYYEKQLAITREIGNRRGEGYALGNLGIAYADLGETKKAIEHHEQNLAIAREIGDRRGEGAALGNLGNAYHGLGEATEAIEHHEQRLAIAREIGDRRGEGAALGNLGNAYWGLGETKKAIEHYEQSLAIAREIGDRRGEGAALGNLGTAYQGLGETKKAIEHHEIHLTIAREIGDRRGEGAALGNLGNAYQGLGEATKAIEHLEKQLAITREISDRRGEGNALGNLGNAYQGLGEATKAIEHLEKQLAITREIGDRSGEGAALGNLGNAYADLGDSTKAIEHYEIHLTIAREIGDRRGEGNALYNWAAEVMKTDPALARRLAGEALALYETISSPNAVDARALLERLSR